MAIQHMAMVDKDGNVVNVIVYDTEGNWSPPEGCVIIDIKGKGPASIGGTWDGVQFAVPIKPPPK